MMLCHPLLDWPVALLGSLASSFGAVSDHFKGYFISYSVSNLSRRIAFVAFADERYEERGELEALRLMVPSTCNKLFPTQFLSNP